MCGLFVNIFLLFSFFHDFFVNLLFKTTEIFFKLFSLILPLKPTAPLGWSVAIFSRACLKIAGTRSFCQKAVNLKEKTTICSRTAKIFHAEAAFSGQKTVFLIFSRVLILFWSSKYFHTLEAKGGLELAACYPPF